MFPPFNRIGGARGPNGTTLDDLKGTLDYIGDQATNQTAWLEGIFNRLNEINGLMQKLVGTIDVPNGWVGLPEYLFRHVSAAAPGDSVTTIRDILRLSIAQSLASLEYGFRDPAAAGQGYLLSQLAAMLIAEEAQRQNTSFDIGAIEAAIGSLGEAPAGQTVKMLLEAIRVEAQRQADCCEETGGVEDPTNDHLTGGCGPYERNTGWLDKGTFVDSGTTYRRWSPLWPSNAIGTSAVWSKGFAVGGQTQVFGLTTANKRGDLCISWNFTGGNIPHLFGRDIVGDEATAKASQVLGTPGLGGTNPLTAGGLIDTVDTCGGANVPRWVAYNFAFVDGVTPAKNVFLGWVDRVCVG